MAVFPRIFLWTFFPHSLKFNPGQYETNQKYVFNMKASKLSVLLNTENCAFHIRKVSVKQQLNAYYVQFTLIGSESSCWKTCFYSRLDAMKIWLYSSAMQRNTLSAILFEL